VCSARVWQMRIQIHTQIHKHRCSTAHYLVLLLYCLLLVLAIKCATEPASLAAAYRCTYSYVSMSERRLHMRCARQTAVGPNGQNHSEIQSLSNFALENQAGFAG
jgi:hypothetical protein